MGNELLHGQMAALHRLESHRAHLDNRQLEGLRRDVDLNAHADVHLHLAVERQAARPRKARLRPRDRTSRWRRVDDHAMREPERGQNESRAACHQALEAARGGARSGEVHVHGDLRDRGRTAAGEMVPAG